jgi:hypothetical protein
MVDARATEIRVTFKSGKHLKVATKRGPKGWRHVLKCDVRYFGADVLPYSAESPTRVSGYDRHGRRIVSTASVQH